MQGKTKTTRKVTTIGARDELQISGPAVVRLVWKRGQRARLVIEAEPTVQIRRAVAGEQDETQAEEKIW